MGHTPSTPKVTQPASATDPRYSTSGILNAQLKEKNRQGLLSTLGGRTGEAMNINKFADAKSAMRDPSAMPALEQLARLYADAATKASAKGVNNKDTSDYNKAAKNIRAYNESVDAVSNYLKQYGMQDPNLVKGEGAHNSDTRAFHDSNYGAKNKGEIKQGVANVGKSGEVFNELEKEAKKQKQPTK